MSIINPPLLYPAFFVFFLYVRFVYEEAGVGGDRFLYRIFGLLVAACGAEENKNGVREA